MTARRDSEKDRVNSSTELVKAGKLIVPNYFEKRNTEPVSEDCIDNALISLFPSTRGGNNNGSNNTVTASCGGAGRNNFVIINLICFYLYNTNCLLFCTEKYKPEVDNVDRGLRGLYIDRGLEFRVY